MYKRDREDEGRDVEGDHMRTGEEPEQGVSLLCCETLLWVKVAFDSGISRPLRGAGDIMQLVGCLLHGHQLWVYLQNCRNTHL